VFNTQVIELISCRFFNQQLGERVGRNVKVRGSIPGASQALEQNEVDVDDISHVVCNN